MAKTYTAMDHRRALMAFMDGKKIAPLAKEMGCSRQTLTTWKRDGLPIEITGGKNWDEYVIQERSRDLEKFQARAADRANQESLEFFETAKADVKVLFDTLKARLLDKEGIPSYADVDRLLTTFIRLDNQASDRVIWMQDMMRKLFTIVMTRVEDDRTLTQIRTDMMQLSVNETRKLGLIPNQKELPKPGDFVKPENAEDAVVTYPE
jgi:hypothetical protein